MKVLDPVHSFVEHLELWVTVCFEKASLRATGLHDILVRIENFHCEIDLFARLLATEVAPVVSDRVLTLKKADADLANIRSIAVK
jgi:hypothetical protein